jgi:ribonuclease HII
VGRWSGVERQLRESHGPYLAGVDEVGRGPLAGPVVACAIVMPVPADHRAIAHVDDSKQLEPPVRERLARLIAGRALALGVGAASVREVETLNIHHATVLAMQRALARCARQLAVRHPGAALDHVVVDGVPLRTLGVPHTAVVKGDAKCYAIACASIVAKVTRDRLMARLARRYPPYGWERNAGYGTAAHRAALASAGLTPHHRRSFCHSAVPDPPSR